jgi:hypothetical protein
MIELVVIGEGYTERRFVTDVLAPALVRNGIRATPRLIGTSSGSRGGALNRDRVRRFARNTLRERRDTFVTTFFDLYGLDSTFRAVEDSRGKPPGDRCRLVEQGLHEDVVTDASCRPDRFLPHVQPHEFEALLFSDVRRLCEAESGWEVHENALREVCADYPNPEWINDSPHSAPSKRLEKTLSPRYRKVDHGPRAAAKIGLDKIREKCPHFGQWFQRISTLKPL